jgi:hypothetical protein
MTARIFAIRLPWPNRRLATEAALMRSGCRARKGGGNNSSDHRNEDR